MALALHHIEAELSRRLSLWLCQPKEHGDHFSYEIPFLPWGYKTGLVFLAATVGGMFQLNMASPYWALTVLFFSSYLGAGLYYYLAVKRHGPPGQVNYLRGILLGVGSAVVQLPPAVSPLARQLENMQGRLQTNLIRDGLAVLNRMWSTQADVLHVDDVNSDNGDVLLRRVELAVRKNRPLILVARHETKEQIGVKMNALAETRRASPAAMFALSHAIIVIRPVGLIKPSEVLAEARAQSPLLKKSRVVMNIVTPTPSDFDLNDAARYIIFAINGHDIVPLSILLYRAWLASVNA